jgi:hypothetical protein
LATSLSIGGTVRDITWERRCEEWGAWRIGAQSMSIATWQRMADGLPLRGAGGSPLPKLNLAALETHALIGHLPLEDQRVLWRVYPKIGKLVDVAAEFKITPETLRNRIHAAHRRLRRLNDQQRRGEPLDVARPRPRSKAELIRVQDGCRTVHLAAVVVGE